MSVSKEVRIGILVSAALVIFFTGFYFLKGADLFSNDKEYTCFYPTVDGLQKSSPVQINGIMVGHVSNMQLAGDRGVKLTLSVSKTIDIPQGTVSSFASADLLGSKIIKLELGKGPGNIPPGSELPAKNEAGVIDALSGELSPRLAELKVTIASFNQTLSNVNSLIGGENQKSLSSAITALDATARNLQKVSEAIGAENGEIKGIIHNTNSITANLAKSNDTVQRILANTSSLTRQLANAPIQKTITDLQKTTGQLQGIMDKINNNQGTLGMLINNKDVYNSLNNTLKSMNNLTDDLKAHPSRYINISLFGGKKKN
jgi:phospholipid/cholesterol/gamma-HCH transport system substrate-binding protein